MKFRLPVFLALVFACLPLHADELLDGPNKHKKKDKDKDKASEVRQPGLVERVVKSLWPFGKKPDGTAATPAPKGSQSGKQWKDLVPTVSIDPMPLKLSDVRTMKVTLQLANHGKKLTQLDFPTSQRIEVLVKDSLGNRVEQWSEDQAFQNDPTLVTINPGERIEYTANVSTRDLKAGQAYSIEAFFPNYDQLRVTKPITPLP
jgi:hypothetical protein